MNNYRRQMRKAKALDKKLTIVPRKKMGAIAPDTGETGQEIQARYERDMINRMRKQKKMKPLPNFDLKRAFNNWSN